MYKNTTVIIEAVVVLCTLAFLYIGRLDWVVLGIVAVVLSDCLRTIPSTM